MALKKRDPSTTPPFETDTPASAAAAPAPAPAPAPAAAVQAEQTPHDTNAAAAAAGHTQPDPAPTAQLPVVTAPAKTGLVLQRPDSAIAISSAKAVIESIKNALPVQWDTLGRVKPVQGAFMLDALNLGDWITFELLSYQDNWLVTPGSDAPEAKNFAKYSDDGKFLKEDGRSIAEYLNEIKPMYPDAKLQQRVVVVGSLMDCAKTVEVDEGKLFQMDLPPTSMSKFNEYINQAAFDMAKQRATPDQAMFIKATAAPKPVTNSNKVYTLVSFTRQPRF